MISKRKMRRNTGFSARYICPELLRWGAKADSHDPKGRRWKAERRSGAQLEIRRAC